MIRVNNIKLNVGHSFEDLKRKTAKILKVKDELIKELKINKKSIDARDKKNVCFVYAVDIAIKNEVKYLNLKNVTQIVDEEYNFKKEIKNKTKRPVVVGSGPAGIFAALILAENGLEPIILERGKNVSERSKDVENFFNNAILNEESNVMFGEGGAGTFSDGKLTTGIKNFRISKVIKEFLECGAPEEIGYVAKPHIGTDKLINVLTLMRKKLIGLGAEFRFSNKLADLIIEDNRIIGVSVLKNNSEKYDIETDKLILALGHSARDTFELLKNKKMSIRRKPFSVGVRIEHRQIEINKSQYGDFFHRLEAAPYKLNHKARNGKGVYSFCMCPGGTVVASSSEKNTIVTNGMSSFARDKENSNAAILIGIGENDFNSDDVFAGIELQKRLEKQAFFLGGGGYKAPVQLLGDFLENRASTMLGNVYPSYQPGFNLTNLREGFDEEFFQAFEESILEFDKRLKGFNSYDAVLTGFETRSSSPIVLERNDEMESSIKGIYPCGEGAGYAGGIMSAAVDGIKCGENVVLSY